MTARRPFRFGVVAASAPNPDVWKATARRAEALGYSTLLLPDLVETTPAPLTALAIAAASTTTLNVGT
jgi:alkanesulfonate monooxygenase SsuD/methylene tetrahydromethanopterin reductase-like flavin-dependent oxidoreductase (luciferase family)